MHEYGLAEGVLATVRQRAGGRKVAGIRVRFGVRHAVDEESLAQAFGFVAEGTEAAGAAVKLVTVPAALACRDCGLTAETTDVLAACPRCAGEDVEITGGDEMTLESITYEPAPARLSRGGDHELAEVQVAEGHRPARSGHRVDVDAGLRHREQLEAVQ